MPLVEKHAPGSFSWLELGTSDQKGAKQFYSSLFGWQPQDYPMGPDNVYTMFQLQGKDVAGCYATAANSPGAPPNWAVYVAVQDADQTARRAAELGGSALKEPFDVFTFGRMAVLKDPTGAIFCIWQPKTHIGTGITGVEGTLCWADLNTPGREGAKTFYEGLFGWRLSPGEGKPATDYLHIQNGEAYIGGVLPDEHRNKQAPPHWLPYFQVNDCDAAAAKAAKLGATVYMPPMAIEGAGRFSVLADPQGAVFAVFQPGPRAAAH